MMGMMGFGAFGWGFMLLFWGCLIALGIGCVVFLFPRRAPAVGMGAKTMGAREILDGRYARGEINREQFETMRRDIETE